MIKSINTLGKFLDQPILISKLDKKMPAIVSLGASAYLAHDFFQKNKNEGFSKENKKDFIEKTVVMACSVASAFMTPKIASKITGRMALEPLEKVREKNIELVENFWIGIENQWPENEYFFRFQYSPLRVRRPYASSQAFPTSFQTDPYAAASR